MHEYLIFPLTVVTVTAGAFLAFAAAQAPLFEAMPAAIEAVSLTFSGEEADTVLR